MKKIFMFLLVFLCSMSFGEITKEEFLQKLIAKYKNTSSLKAEAEMRMDMMGKIMTIPMKFWKKGKNFKMEMTYQQPGMEKPMEMLMVFDGTKMLQYHKTTNTVMKFDLTKFPQDLRSEWEKKYNAEKSILPDLEKISDNLQITEKVKNGENFYVLTVEDLQNLSKKIPSLKSKNTQFFKRAIVWFHRDMSPERISLYADSEKPGMEIIFKSLNTVSSLPDSIFKIDIPDDAKVIDMTDMIVNMMKNVEVGPPQK